MCVNCEFQPDGTPVDGFDPESDRTRSYMVVCPNQSTITVDYPLSWVTTLKVTTMAEPYGKVLFEGSDRDGHRVQDVLEPGVYTVLAGIGSDYADKRWGVLIWEGPTGQPAFVRISTKRP